MKAPRRQVLLLHGERTLAERLRRAGQGHFDLVVLESWDELFERVGSAAPSAVLVLDPAHEAPRGAGIAPDLKGLLNQYPSLNVVAVLDAIPATGRDLLELGALGVSNVLLLSEELEPVACRARIEQARGRPLRALLARSISPQVSGPGRAILGVAVSTAIEAGNATHLSRAMHVTPRTLLRWCRRAGLPAPRQLLAWLRMLIAAELLDDAGRSVLDVALACGYASDASLRNAVTNFLRRTPTELRAAGAFRAASDGFFQALAEARDQGRRYRRQAAGR